MVLIWLIKEVLYNFFFVMYKNEWEYLFNLLPKNKERLKKQARDKYRNLSEEEKNKKREYGKNRYHNISEEKKQKLKEYQKNYCEAKKCQYKKQMWL